MTEHVLQRLLEHKPRWLEEFLHLVDPIQLVMIENGKCVSSLGRVLIPKTLAESKDDLIAFGIAYSLGFDLLGQVFRKSKGFFQDMDPLFEKIERLPNLVGIPMAVAIGTVSMPVGYFRSGREIGEIEAVSIENAIAWLHDAGFDLNAAGDYFELGFGLIRKKTEPKDPKLRAAGKAIGVAFRPVTFAMDRTREGREIFKSDAERINFARQTARSIATS